MADSNSGQTPHRDDVQNTSDDCELIVIREEDTQPGTRSDGLRKWLETKYGKKAPSPKPPETS